MKIKVERLSQEQNTTISDSHRKNLMILESFPQAADRLSAGSSPPMPDTP